MANGAGLDLLGLLQYQRRQTKEQRSTITDLMKIFSQEAIKSDTDSSYDEGIELIGNVKKKDEYTDLIGDLLIRNLSIEKDHNKLVEDWYDYSEEVFTRAGKVDPTKPTEFQVMLNQLTQSGINLSKRTSETEQAGINQKVKFLVDYRKKVEGLEGERIMQALSKELKPEDKDADLVHIALRQTPQDDYGSSKGIALSQYTRKQSAIDAKIISDASSIGDWQEYAGIGNSKDAKNIYKNITNQYNFLSNTLNGMRGNDSRGGTFSLQVGTEKITGSGKEQGDVNFYQKIADHMGRFMGQIFGELGATKIWKAFRNDHKKKDGESKSEWNARLTKLMIKDGAYTDKFLQTGMDILERNDGKDLWPLYLKPLFGDTKNMKNKGLLENDKLPMINAYHMAINIYEDAIEAQSRADQNINMFKGIKSPRSSVGRGNAPWRDELNPSILNVMDMLDLNLDFGNAGSSAIQMFKDSSNNKTPVIIPPSSKPLIPSYQRDSREKNMLQDYFQNEYR